MKRSEINQIIQKAEAFFAERRFHLPPFASWTPDEWLGKGREADEIRRKHLGWDLTDFGSGQFETNGLLLFTLRNGDPHKHHDAKCYAEKIMIVGEGQRIPWHFHWIKTEDIINRGGGVLAIDLAWATGDDGDALDDERDIEVACDGVQRRIGQGGRLMLAPGESITLPPSLYHRFHGSSGTGPVLVGEVSRTNDDTTDNRFLEELGRFPHIEEDVTPYRLLCHEYPPAHEA